MILPPSNNSGIAQTNLKLAETINVLNQLSDGILLRPHPIITASREISLGASIVPVDVTAGAITVTLPLAKKAQNRVIYIKHIAGNTVANNITIAAQGGQTIDGSASLLIATNYGIMTLWSDGANWFRL